MDTRTRDEDWAAYADALELNLEVAALWRELRAVRLALAQRRIAALEHELKYRPDQPRVPAGYREGGQWTVDGAGTPSAHPRRGSPSGDVETQPSHRPPLGAISERETHTPDLGEIFGIGTADAAERPRPPKIYRVDIREEDARGGHTKEEHVGKSDEYLLRRMRQQQITIATGPIVYVRVTFRIGSFPTVSAANALTSSNLAQNSEVVDRVATGQIKRNMSVTSWYRSPTGKEAFANQSRQSGSIRPTFGVRTIIRHEPGSRNGFIVVSSFPVNR